MIRARRRSGSATVALLCAALAAGAAATVGCSGAPLPLDLERAQEREGERDLDGALADYRRVREDCDTRGKDSRPHDDCGLAATREAQLLERLGRYAEAETAWLAVPGRSSDRKKGAHALSRAAELLAEKIGDAAAAQAVAWRTVENYPDEGPADDALALGVRLGRKSPRALAARLDALLARFASVDIGDNLLYARAELARTELADPAGAVARYDELAARFRRSGLRDDALWHAALVLREQRDFEGALRRLRQILATRKDALFTGSYNSVLLDDTQLLVGRIYLDDLHDPEHAAEAFENLADDYPESVLRDDGLYDLARARLARHDPPTDADRQGACAALARLQHQFPDGNQVRRARALASQLGCG